MFPRTSADIPQPLALAYAATPQQDPFEITCYSCGAVEDEITEDFRGAADGRRDVAQLSDDELVK